MGSLCIYIKIHVIKIAKNVGSGMSKECSLHRTAYQVAVPLELIGVNHEYFCCFHLVKRTYT